MYVVKKGICKYHNQHTIIDDKCSTMSTEYIPHGKDRKMTKKQKKTQKPQTTWYEVCFIVIYDKTAKGKSAQVCFRDAK